MGDVFDAALGKTVEDGEQTGEYLYRVTGLGGTETWCQEEGQEPVRVYDCNIWCDIRQGRYNWNDDQRCNCSHFACEGCTSRQSCNRGCDE